MRSIRYAIIIALIIISLSHAQDSSQWHLPDGAKMRLGKGRLYDFDYSPDGTKIALATGIGIWIYDAQTGEALDLFTGGNAVIRNVAFSPDGKTLMSDIDNNRLCLWDVNSGKQLHRYAGHTQYSISEIVFNPDGKTFASADSSGDVRVWDVESRRHLFRASAGGSANSIAYSPDGKLLAAAADYKDGWILLYDAYTGDDIRWLITNTRMISCLAFSPDGKTLASGSYDNTVRLWDVDLLLTRGIEYADMQRDIILSHSDYIIDIEYSRDGRYLATASKDKTIYLWDTSSGNNIRHVFRSDTHYPRKIAFSPDNHTLVSRYSDNTIRVRHDRGYISSFWREHIITGHRYNGSLIDISPDGNTLVCGSDNHALSLWDVNTATLQHSLIGHTAYVQSVAFSPVDNNLIASGSNDGTLRLWNADTGTERNTIINVVGDVVSVAFSPDGNTVACAITYGEYTSQSRFRDSNIHLFDVETGDPLQTITAHIAMPTPRNQPEFHPTLHVDPVNKITFSHDGKTLVSHSWDKTIRFWDVQTGDHLRVLKRGLGQIQISSVVYNADGKILASGTDYGEEIIEIWDVTTGIPKLTLTTYADEISSVMLNPNGTTFVSVSEDGNIHLWDIQTGRLLSTYKGHKGRVFEVAFLPDGSTLATGGDDGTILLWDTTVRLPSNTAVALSPTDIISPVVGKQFTLSLNITEGQNVSAYQATVEFDPTALRYVESRNEDYLHDSAFVMDPMVDTDTVTISATTFAQVSYDDGTLATITFEVIAIKDSTVMLSDVLLTDLYGNTTTPVITSTTEITAPTILPEDVNEDDVVNVLDLIFVAANFGKTGKNAADVNNDGVVNVVDMALVAGAIGNNGDAAAPTLWSDNMPTRATVETWLREARQINLSDPQFQRGILVLEQLLRNLTPKETALLPNYPNPFNPETWIPYQLSGPSDVSIKIYSSDGKLVRQLDLGHQPVGIYQHRTQAAYWDGKNAIGEPVASGVYFYTLSAGPFTVTRKMLIRK